MKRTLHAGAGIVAFATIAVFWTSTVWAELFGSTGTIHAVKRMILTGLLVLIPAIAIAGGSGMSMGRRRKDAPARAKMRRMPLIAANGIVVLVPAAFFLEARAAAGTFDAPFLAVQALELLAGAVNLVLMGLNIRDGRAMARSRVTRG
ncbi:MAG: hypothetical protein K8F31_04110 [Roseovarius sp.]|nr:hypothetical protein [Roseovarius sp.]